MSDTGHLPPVGGPPPGPAGRPLPPPPPPPAHAMWWIALVAIGAVVVAIAAVVGIAIVASDDATAPTTARRSPPTFMVVPVETAPPQPAGIAFTDPDGTYTITLGPDWSDISSRMAAGTEAWAIADASDGFSPNVNVLTQETPGADLESLLAGSIADVQRVGGEVTDHAYVTATDGTELGTLAYTVASPGSPIELSFIAVFGVRDGATVIATLTAPTASVAALAEEITPYLLTLRVTG